MFAVHHPDQALHDPGQVFRLGALIPQPDRAERCRIFLGVARSGGHQVVTAPDMELDPILQVPRAGPADPARTGGGYLSPRLGGILQAFLAAFEERPA